MEAGSNLYLKKSKPDSRKEVSDDSDAAIPIDILVDIIIGLLENSNAFSRVVANQAFSLLSSKIEESTIALIVTVYLLVSRYSDRRLSLLFIATGPTRSKRS